MGAGEVSVLYIGGDLGRAECVAVGDPLDQAFGAEHHGAKPASVATSLVHSPHTVAASSGRTQQGWP